MKYRIGLDVGANSLGWSVAELDETGITPVRLVDAGARIFSDGRNVKSKATLKADRRAARSARRRRDRYKQRRAFLLAELTELGLFPEDRDKAKRASLQKKDPLQLRSEALEQELLPYQIGRALFHLNQRRGFKSNRKDAESRDGVVKRSTEELQRKLEEAGAPTLGAFLWRRRKDRLPTRARRHGKKKTDLYEFYPTRDLLEKEFDKIWSAQKEYHPDLLTEASRERIHKVIFTQRPLKPAVLGKCSYMPDKDRTYKAMPSFQRYRVYQEVNNLEWATSTGRQRLIDCPEARDRIVEMLERPTTQKGNVTFGNMKKALIKMGIAEGDFQFNLETEKRKSLDGNLTSNLMQRAGLVELDWHNWPLVGYGRQFQVMQAQLALSEPRRKRAWQKIVRAKIRNQAEVLSHFGCNNKVLLRLATQVKSGDTSNTEAQAARMYWQSMFGDDFRRDRSRPGINAALNYIYTVLRACVARGLSAAGLHPSFSVHHKNPQNPFNLADDFIEPFRPLAG